MSEGQFDTFDDFIDEFDKEPGRRRLYRREKARFDLIVDLIQLRQEASLTQAELAQKLGKHQSSIARIESGEHDIRLGTLIEIADALDAYVDLRLVKRYEVSDSEWQRLISIPAPAEEVAAVSYSGASGDATTRSLKFE